MDKVVRRGAAPAAKQSVPEGSVFERFSDQDIRDLIAEFPLAWVCARDGLAEHASLLPLIGEYDAAGRLTHLVGHHSRRNALMAVFSADPRAFILFKGPDGYISPADAGSRTWGPTWNYAELRIEADISFGDISGDEALSVLTDTMEATRPEPWRTAELGERYAGMRDRIIGFRARVIKLRGRFKLGQDERPETLRNILANVRDPALARWMRRFNAGREIVS